MGKQAAISYLQGEGSLNDAIIKLAQMHPSISTHQVRRVIEFANQETFSRLFSDGEKYANVVDGWMGIAFVCAAVESSKKGSAWVSMAKTP